MLVGGRPFRHVDQCAELISADVKWRVDERRLNEAFPQNGNVILVVIDGETPELAEAAAAKLSARMAADPAHFSAVRRPDGGAFFAQNGLLFAESRRGAGRPPRG